MLLKKELEKPASHTSSSSTAEGHLGRGGAGLASEAPWLKLGRRAAAEDMREEAFQAWTLVTHPKTQYSFRLHLQS